MATDQNFSGGQEKPQGSPETELPRSALLQGALDGTQDDDCETWHLSFRAFTSSETSDPLEDLRRLGELCYLWLRPDLHTKEQILDALVLEQFLISMPPELQVLVKESGVRSCEDLRDLLRSNKTPKTWVSRAFLMGRGSWCGNCRCPWTGEDMGAFLVSGSCWEDGLPLRRPSAVSRDISSCHDREEKEVTGI